MRCQLAQWKIVEIHLLAAAEHFKGEGHSI